jgi:hypothetical protein
MADEFLITFGYIGVVIVGLCLVGLGLKLAVDRLKVYADRKAEERHGRHHKMNYGGTKGAISSPSEK